MAWIESHQEIRDHPKTAILSEIMGWNKYETVGRLHCFWYWCLSYAPTGELTKFSYSMVAASLEITKSDSQKFVEAMVEAGWLDQDGENLLVHDWPQYAGRYLKDSKFKRCPEKWEQLQRVYGLSADCPQTVDGLSALPNPTNPPTRPDTTKPTKEKKARESAKDVFQTLSIPDNFLTAEFRERIATWIDRRMNGKKPGCSWQAFFQEQVDWLSGYELSVAVGVLSAAIRNGYTGLPEPKGGMHRPSQKRINQIQENITPNIL